MNIDRWYICLPLVAVLAGLLQSPANGTEYFISNKAGGGSGTLADPFGMADLPPAADMYDEGNACSALRPGDTLTFLPGTYELHTSNATVCGYIRPACSGTPGKPITFRAKPGGKVVLRSVSGQQGVLGTVKIRGWRDLDHVRFYGFIVECRLAFDKKSNPELNGMRLQGKHNEVAWCKFVGQYLATTNNFDGIRIESAAHAWIHHNEIVGWKGDHWNSNGIKIYCGDECVIEDNYVHGNHTGIFDKDAAAGNIYRRNYITGNTAGAFLGSNQTKSGRSDARYYVSENVIDGPVNLLTLSRGIEIHDNLLFASPTNPDHVGSALFASGGKVYQTKVWNNVYIVKQPKVTGYAMDLTPWSATPPDNPLDYCDHNVYDGTPDYRFGRWGGKPQATFTLEQMRSLGFEKNTQIVTGVAEIYEDQKGYKLRPQWLKAGRKHDPVGPDDVATLLDVTRYGPSAMPSSAGGEYNRLMPPASENKGK